MSVDELAAAIEAAHGGDLRAIARECATLAIENDRLEASVSFAYLRRKRIAPARPPKPIPPAIVDIARD